MDLDKYFDLGIVVGRFQILHSGHEGIINTAINMCDRVVIFIGSAQESRTSKNPFAFEERKKIILSSCLRREWDRERVKILPLNDQGLGNNQRWGEYIISQLPQDEMRLYINGETLVVSGREAIRESWFKNEFVSELYLDKKPQISSTRMMAFLKYGCRDEWKSFLPSWWQRYADDEQLDQLYSTMRNIILDTRDNTETSSI